MKVALAQINPTIGDIEGNTAMILERIQSARAAGADLVVLPELAVFGYPPKDLLRRVDLVQRNVSALKLIAKSCTDVTAIVGYVEPDSSAAGKGIHNAAAVCCDGQVVKTYAKALLPCYDVFDEVRHFSPGRTPATCSIRTGKGTICVGLSICEDLWNDRQFEGRSLYGFDPIRQAVAAGAQLLINLSASPYRVGVQEQRESLFGDQIRQHGVPLIYVNQVGGNDDLIFDGASLVLDDRGRIAARARAFSEDFLTVDLDSLSSARVAPYPDGVAGIQDALILGLRDYMEKCRFETAVIGLSGGVDSALTAALAVEALGSDRVRGVCMPSRYSSSHSSEDAELLAENLNIRLMTIPIEEVHRAMEGVMAPHFAAQSIGVADENIQARIRGNILMALSNQFGWLLLTTGNKSELAVGYCTLYGDMCGGLALLSDVPKTIVYELARHINESSGRPCIPRRSIDKEPSAELRADQRDQDTLPPYETLDAILEHLIERDLGADEIVALGFERATVEEVGCMVERNEYKRSQAPIGLKVTSRAFGSGRRMPIAARFG